MDKLTAIKIKYDDGTYSDEIPVSVLSENVEWDNTHTLVDVLGSIDVDVTGTIQDQISRLFNEKVSSSELNNYIANQLNTDITNWLNQNVNPVGSAVVVDNSLTVSGAAADAKVTGKEIAAFKNILLNNFEIKSNFEPNLINGSFIDVSNNKIAFSDSFAMTEPIPVKKKQIITLKAKGYNTNVGMIAICDANNTSRQTVVKSIDSNEHEYIYNIAEDGYIVCSFNYRSDYSINISIDYYNLIENMDFLGFIQKGAKEISLLSQISNSFINSTNNHVDSSDNFFITQSILLYQGQTLNLIATGYRAVVGMISEYNPISNTYITLVNSIDNDEHLYSYTAEKTIIVRCSVNKLHTYSAEIITPESRSTLLDEINNEINELKDPLKIIQYPQMFTNIICMGDSLTRGESGGSQSVQLTTNYPFYFKKLTQADITNQSQGGITTQGFWNTFASTYDYTPFDCAVIFLGTNGGLTDTVETDCNVDYTQNADTNTGCYGKIIGRIKATAPKCKIFLVAGVNDYVRRATTMNPAVRKLATFYNVGLIDIENCIMSDSGAIGTTERYLYRPIDGIHYNRLGYMTLANMFYDSMLNFIEKNLNMYND